MTIVNRGELVDLLAKIKPALGKRDIITQSQHFIFANEEVFAYNDELFISHPFKSGLECTVRADEFYKILQRIQTDKVDIILADDKLQIKAGKLRSHLTVEKGDGIIELVEGLGFEQLIWQPLPVAFIEGIGLCLSSTSKDASQGALTCIFVSGENLFSTDDVRISWYSIGMALDPFLLPARAAAQLIKYPIIEYSVGASWTHFRTADGVVFSSRQISEDFPDVTEFFDGEGVRVKLPANLRETVERIGVLAEGDIEIDKQITLKFTTDNVTCFAEKKGIGWIEEDITTVYRKEPFEFSINPAFFSQILAKATSMRLLEGKAVFTSGEFKHLIALPLAE